MIIERKQYGCVSVLLVQIGLALFVVVVFLSQAADGSVQAQVIKAQKVADATHGAPDALRLGQTQSIINAEISNLALVGESTFASHAGSRSVALLSNNTLDTQTQIISAEQRAVAEVIDILSKSGDAVYSAPTEQPAASIASQGILSLPGTVAYAFQDGITDETGISIFDDHVFDTSTHDIHTIGSQPRAPSFA